MIFKRVREAMNITIKLDDNGRYHFRTDEAARELGMYQERDGVKYIKWTQLKAKLADFGIKTEPMPAYLDEDIFMHLLLETRTQDAAALRRFIPVHEALKGFIENGGAG